MAELPLDYLSKHFASPLARLPGAEDLYDLVTLWSTILALCPQYIT
jgi:hypothetical protein